ncbi:MAG TPA: lysozyme inhibitor LprI family protein [Acidobacteriaceae bacterium]|nr:lysozyme inhibitor LprI family protein [Acidobacteriaceae bacterium]
MAIFMIAVAAIGQEEEAKPSEACAKYAPVALPAEAQSVVTPKAAPGCASYKSYRGIGRLVNYGEARACAWQERAAQKADLGQNEKEPIAWFVGGSLILADIYYNGAGVAVDKPLAMRFACEADDTMAQLMMDDLAKPSGPQYAHKPFEFCDYATTTFAMNFCGEYQQEIADDRRGREYERLKVAMTSEQRATFDRLLVAERAYIEAHASEVYQGGTIRGIRTMGSQEILEKLFHGEVMQLERRQWPTIQQAQIDGSDATMAQEYRAAQGRIRAQPKDEFNEDVTAEGLLNAQRAWLKYRNAWSAFAKARYPEHAAAISAEITLDRYRLLKTIP